MNKKQIEGKYGEDEATKFLRGLGYEIICNNFRCMQGEIDIIAIDNEEIVFIEVKTRSNTRYGEAREAVNIKKKQHILNSAMYYLYKSGLEDALVRIDVIEVYTKRDEVVIKHIKQAI